MHFRAYFPAITAVFSCLSGGGGAKGTDDKPDIFDASEVGTEDSFYPEESCIEAMFYKEVRTTCLTIYRLYHKMINQQDHNSFIRPANFTVCIHDPVEDSFISRAMRLNGTWEPHVGITLAKILDVYNGDDDEFGINNAVLLDIGAHIGIHSLYVAALGHKAYAVEPLKANLIRVSLRLLEGAFWGGQKILSNFRLEVVPGKTRETKAG